MVNGEIYVKLYDSDRNVKFLIYLKLFIYNEL